MSTFLFDKIIFGPVNSRRLGISLGINLLPTDLKVCNFNCVYCECGLTSKNSQQHQRFYTREEIASALAARLASASNEYEVLDSITFAGNGEPTLHPDFPMIIEDTIELRDFYYPETKITVLSNATTLKKDYVADALQKVDNIILKLDSGNERTIKLINSPLFDFYISDLVTNLKKFEGKLIIQTLFLKGFINGQVIDNTSDDEVLEWIKLLKIINPKLVMIYTFARNTPSPDLEKASLQRMNEICEMVNKEGINGEVFD